MSTYFTNETSSESEKGNWLTENYQKVSVRIQFINDKLLYYRKERWIAVAVLTLIYFLRLVYTGGYHALTYCLGIHILNSFLGFISPFEDPDENEDGGSFLPQK